jgi:putative pyruvate formate lyase activating enzyme
MEIFMEFKSIFCQLKSIQFTPFHGNFQNAVNALFLPHAVNHYILANQLSLPVYSAKVKNILPETRLRFLIEPFASCTICPRNCNVNRLLGEVGVCGSDAGFNISSICIHHGEEPVISGVNGICNVFFSRCNLSCMYCQNYQISCNRGAVNEAQMQLHEVVDTIIEKLDQGCHAVGFVSPSHYIPHVKAIIESLRFMGRNPVFVYNTNGYDKVELIRSLESYIDVYLPDYKYSDNNLARKFSRVADYQQTAFSAIREMYRQKGSTLVMNEDGYAEKGLIIRHLVLPGNIDNSIHVLRQIADISNSISVSLMAQYYPTLSVKEHPELGRTLTFEEYETIKAELDKIGFYKGWIQEIESSGHYLPDFGSDKPFS